jgi:hypothetical protein
VPFGISRQTLPSGTIDTSPARCQRQTLSDRRQRSHRSRPGSLPRFGRLLAPQGRSRSPTQPEGTDETSTERQVSVLHSAFLGRSQGSTSQLSRKRGSAMTACAPCGHASEHGWWGSSIPRNATHCRQCHSTWKGVGPAHCTVCHRSFGGNTVADKAGCPNCASDSVLGVRGIQPDSEGIWRLRPPASRTVSVGWAATQIPQVQNAGNATSCEGGINPAVSDGVRDGVDDE